MLILSPALRQVPDDPIIHAVLRPSFSLSRASVTWLDLVTGLLSVFPLLFDHRVGTFTGVLTLKGVSCFSPQGTLKWAALISSPIALCRLNHTLLHTTVWLETQPRVLLLQRYAIFNAVSRQSNGALGPGVSESPLLFKNKGTTTTHGAWDNYSATAAVELRRQYVVWTTIHPYQHMFH